MLYKYKMNDTTLKSSNKEECFEVTINNKLLRLTDVNIIASLKNLIRQSLQKNLSDDKKDINLRHYKVYVKPNVKFNLRLNVSGVNFHFSRIFCKLS